MVNKISSDRSLVSACGLHLLLLENIHHQAQSSLERLVVDIVKKYPFESDWMIESVLSDYLGPAYNEHVVHKAIRQVRHFLSLDRLVVDSLN